EGGGAKLAERGWGARGRQLQGEPNPPELPQTVASTPSESQSGWVKAFLAVIALRHSCAQVLHATVPTNSLPSTCRDQRWSRKWRDPAFCPTRNQAEAANATVLLPPKANSVY